MPYIKQEDKPYIQFEVPETAGELNFLLTTVCKGFLDKQGVRYEVINTIIGVLECAKQEFYRRVAVPYEDSKIVQNGDVYT